MYARRQERTGSSYQYQRLALTLYCLVLFREDGPVPFAAGEALSAASGQSVMGEISYQPGGQFPLESPGLGDAGQKVRATGRYVQ